MWRGNEECVEGRLAVRELCVLAAEKGKGLL